jgi:hypothetical protein
MSGSEHALPIRTIQRNSRGASHLNLPMIPRARLHTSPTNWGSCSGSC